MITKSYVNQIAYEIVGCAIEVHRHLGPGLLESVYETCLMEELLDKGFDVERQVLVPISYKGKNLDSPLRIDLLVNDLVVVELKASEKMKPLYKAQLLTYLKLTEKSKGLLINFNCENITREGLVPMVTELFEQLPEE